MVIILRLGPFADSLCKKLATNLNKLKRRVAKFMKLEEFCEFQSQVRAKSELEKPEEKEKLADLNHKINLRKVNYLGFPLHLTEC